MEKKSIKNNLEYFWMYYKWQLLAVVVILGLVISSIVAAATKKETVLSVMFFDCHTEVSGEQMEKEYLKAANLDEKQYTAVVQNNLMFEDTESGNYAMTSLSRFMADIGSEKLDVCAMLETDFRKYEKSGTFLDLRECMTEEEFSSLNQELIYAKDGSIIGIYADSLPGMERYGCYEAEETKAGIGIIYNTPHRERAVEYLRFLSGIEQYEKEE